MSAEQSVAHPATQASTPLLVRHLGCRPYEPVWRAMQAFTNARTAETPDELWLVQHAPIFTLGQAGQMEHVLAPGDIPVLRVDRGGQVTYHGPGQVVAYPLLDLRRLHFGVHDLVHRIEQAVIDTLAEWNIGATRRDGAPGVYVAGAKIAALGLRIRHGCTFHGLALNVAMDLGPFRRIDPCGYVGLAVTQVRDLGGPSRVEDVEAVLVQELAREFQLTPQAAPAAMNHWPHDPLSTRRAPVHACTNIVPPRRIHASTHPSGEGSLGPVPYAAPGTRQQVHR